MIYNYQKQRPQQQKQKQQNNVGMIKTLKKNVR